VISPEQIIVPLLAPNTQLVVSVWPQTPGYVDVSLHAGEYPSGKRIAFVTVKRADVRVSLDPSDASPSLWFGSLSPDIAWLEMLRVADFLQLDIPMPHPLPGDAPAGEVRA
jgi:hypothetical protein